MFFKVDLIKLQIAPCFTGKYVDIHIISSSLGPARALAGRGTVAGHLKIHSHICASMNQKYHKIGSTPNKIESHFGLHTPHIYIYIYLCVVGTHHYMITTFFQGCLNQAAIMGMDGVLLLMGRPCHTFSGRHSVTWSAAGVNNTPVGIYHQNPSANNRGNSRCSPP